MKHKGFFNIRTKSKYSQHMLISFKQMNSLVINTTDTSTLLILFNEPLPILYISKSQFSIFKTY